MKLTYTLFVLLALGGCGQYSIRNIDKPAPPEWEGWAKPGATPLDVKKALLECGAPSPDPNSRSYEAIGINTFDDRMNRYFLIRACMERAGFYHQWGSDIRKLCADSNFPERKEYPTCQPDSVIPARNVERRLNSTYCRSNLDKDYCYTVYGKAICDRTFENSIKYRITYPECKP